jgi:2-polyprenyl-3-methyl-5-hydroxy-6-metoxy-1,4-benzoquinol methylase
MNLEELKANWNELGATDPLWAILSVPEYKGNRWNVEEFFRSGEIAVAELLGRIGGQLGLPLRRRRALDFGCGVGRLTQALALHFDEVHGVDIAPSMIEGARRANSTRRNCVYHLNERDDLAIFDDEHFDFVLSEIVLQHMQADYALRYIGELVRVLSPGGLLIFQVPYESVVPTSPPEAWDPTMEARIDMFATPVADVVAAITEAGGRLLRVEETDISGPDWRSYRYAATRASAPVSS